MATSKTTQRRLELGLTVPLLLVVAFLVDFGSRFVSYDGLAYHAWEAMKRRGALRLGGEFEPNKRYVNERTYGDLAAFGNLPAFRQYRTEVFTTDAYGFRNPPSTRSEPPVAVLAGSSFSAGSSLRDDELLSVRLERHLGGGVYNAATVDLADDGMRDKLLDRLRMTKGTVIVEQVENLPALYPVFSPPSELERRVEALLGSHYAKLLLAHGWVRGFLRDSPLELMLFRAFKLVENDRVLPNSFRGSVVEARLANGDPILFMKEQVVQSWPRTPAEQAVRFWQSLASKLAARGLDLVVVLVPSQYEVYGPLSVGACSTTGAEGVAYLGELERRLRERGIAVVNVTDAFRARAREGLSRRDYIYWRDDTHWNGEGAALAAREIAAHFPRDAPPDIKSSAPGSGRGRRATLVHAERR